MRTWENQNNWAGPEKGYSRSTIEIAVITGTLPLEVGIAQGTSNKGGLRGCCCNLNAAVDYEEINHA